MAGYLPVSNAVMNVFSFAANAAETGTYGYLTYTDYGDYISITDCDTLAETYEYTFKTIDSIPLGDVNSDSIVGRTGRFCYTQLLRLHSDRRYRFAERIS